MIIFTILIKVMKYIIAYCYYNLINKTIILIILISIVIKLTKFI